ncbi:hypothetical protein [Cognatiluteimonas telluris]|uniref:hypothetical protein n=1 Tax=Cognatiluteimonas telluris TaxID=1104775 RepID=UPI001407D48F|nr:hypothetical protein [Lysobacter telluris]
MNHKRTAAILLALCLAGCSSASDMTHKGSVAWQYNNASPSGDFQFKCVASTSGECRAEFFDSSSKALQVVNISAGQSATIKLPAAATYLLISPDETLSLLAKTNKLQQGAVVGSQEFNKDHV